jgi:hypothetical protein
MKNKANGRSALILATGLFVCFAAPSQAAAGGDNATANSKSENAAGAPLVLTKNLKQGSHQKKSYAHGKSGTVAVKPAADQKSAADQKAAAPDDGGASPALPPTVANAKAQLPSADTPAGNAMAMSARANEIRQAAPDDPANAKADNKADNGTQVVAADQLNDLDRALHQGNPPPANLVLASADPPHVAAAGQESSTWDRTSLIGKIFIGFGALLTMASAARMFMA